MDDSLINYYTYLQDEEKVKDAFSMFIKYPVKNFDQYLVMFKTLKRYLGFLKENILLPYQVTGSDGYFTYYSPKTKRGDLKGSDKFEIIAFDEDIQNCSNLFVKARRLNSQGGVFSLQLFELEAIDQTTIECKILEDYTYWISHYL